jgi:pSer/pThr/pTyr-binding forkhead associated (FHA) protein
MNAHLRVVQGKPHGHRLDFAPGEFVFGRGPECHIRPNSELVSRQHCMLKVAGDGALSIRDLGSTNGTLVNGRRVLGELALTPGDTLQLGPVILEVMPGDVPPAAQVNRPTDEVRSMGETVAM